MDGSWARRCPDLGRPWGISRASVSPEQEGVTPSPPRPQTYPQALRHTDRSCKHQYPALPQLHSSLLPWGRKFGNQKWAKLPGKSFRSGQPSVRPPRRLPMGFLGSLFGGTGTATQPSPRGQVGLGTGTIPIPIPIIPIPIPMIPIPARSSPSRRAPWSCPEPWHSSQIGDKATSWWHPQLRGSARGPALSSAAVFWGKTPTGRRRCGRRRVPGPTRGIPVQKLSKNTKKKLCPPSPSRRFWLPPQTPRRRSFVGQHLQRGDNFQITLRRCRQALQMGPRAPLVAPRGAQVPCDQVTNSSCHGKVLTYARPTFLPLNELLSANERAPLRNGAGQAKFGAPTPWGAVHTECLRDFGEKHHFLHGYSQAGSSSVPAGSQVGAGSAAPHGAPQPLGAPPAP